MTRPGRHSHRFATYLPRLRKSGEHRKRTLAFGPVHAQLRTFPAAHLLPGCANTGHFPLNQSSVHYATGETRCQTSLADKYHRVWANIQPKAAMQQMPTTAGISAFERRLTSSASTARKDAKTLPATVPTNIKHATLSAIRNMMRAKPAISSRLCLASVRAFGRFQCFLLRGPGILSRLVPIGALTAGADFRLLILIARQPFVAASFALITP